ncbi:MAG: hypothetical protein K2K92_00390 [Duncaniella sp.]|nr:hypothetical protein [Duncaniella sp.]
MRQPLLVINAIGGLANRLRAIGWALHTASLTGRCLRIVWAVNDDLHASFTDLFDGIDIPVITPGPVSYALEWELPRRKNLYVSTLWQRMHFSRVFTDTRGIPEYFDRPDDFIMALDKTAGNILISSGLTLDIEASARFYSLCHPIAEVQELIDKRTSRFNDSTVGVHIRRTDNAQSIGRSPLRLFEEEMARRIALNPDVNFFVCSDDRSVMYRLKECFGARIICGDTDASRTTLSGMRNATADMFALARTSVILGSYWSSFSETAAMIGNIPLQVIKTPD